MEFKSNERRDLLLFVAQITIISRNHVTEIYVLLL